MSAVIAAIVMLGGFALFFWTARWTGSVANRYRFAGAFQGVTHRCGLLFSHFESEVACAIGADEVALYIFFDAQTAKWTFGRWGARPMTRFDLRIPWKEVDFGTEGLFARRTWFKACDGKIRFSIPETIGEELTKMAKSKTRWR